MFTRTKIICTIGPATNSYYALENLVLSAIGCWFTSYFQGYKDQAKAIDLSSIDFSTSYNFNFNAGVIIFVLAIIYVALA